jgi:hypothetical protein
MTNKYDWSRGKPPQRRKRKLWLLSPESGFGGDGTYVMCAMQLLPNCIGLLTYETLTVDLYPKPRREGGRYTPNNIRPACHPCNSYDGALHSVYYRRK